MRRKLLAWGIFPGLMAALTVSAAGAARAEENAAARAPVPDAGSPPPPLAPDDNAALTYVEAARLLMEDKDLVRADWYFNRAAENQAPVRPREKRVEQFLAKAEPVLAALARGDARPRTAWPEAPHEDPEIIARLPEREPIRRLRSQRVADLAIWRARVRAGNDDFPAAFRDLAAAARLGLRLAAPSDSPARLVNYYNGMAIAARAQNALPLLVDRAERAQWLRDHWDEWPRAPEERMGYAAAIRTDLLPRLAAMAREAEASTDASLRELMESRMLERFPALRNPDTPMPEDLLRKLDTLTRDGRIAEIAALSRAVEKTLAAWDKTEAAFFADLRANPDPSPLDILEAAAREIPAGPDHAWARETFGRWLGRIQGHALFYSNEFDFRQCRFLLDAGIEAVLRLAPPAPDPAHPPGEAPASWEPLAAKAGPEALEQALERRPLPLQGQRPLLVFGPQAGFMIRNQNFENPDWGFYLAFGSLPAPEDPGEGRRREAPAPDIKPAPEFF